MSSTNHIIIPIVDCRLNLEDQKVFVPTYSLLTPSKRTEFPELAFWKKSSSAFKKFKQKKDRKEKRKETSNQNSEIFMEVKQRRCLKLVPREKMPLQAMRQNTNPKDLHYEYFDPNEAPLLETASPCKDDMLSKSTEQKSTPEKDQEIIQYINQQKMDLENKEEVVGLKMEIQPRQDDPFIIIRKDNGRKSRVRNCGEIKGGKTKVIKKERAFKGKESDQQDREKYILNRISRVMDSDEMRNQDLPIPALIKSKTSQSPSRKEQNQSQSISSSQENPRPYLQQCQNTPKIPFLQILSFPQPQPQPSIQCHCILLDNKETQCKFNIQFLVTSPMKSVQHITSVFNIPEIEDQVDFKKMYEKEKRTRIFYERKAKELEGKLSKYMKENKHLFGKNKQQDIYNIIQEIKSFKGMLPNSVKEIEISQSASSLDQNNAYGLIKEHAVYGLKDEHLRHGDAEQKCQAGVVNSSQNVSQILEHTSKLVFPSGTWVRHYEGKQAFDRSMDIVNINKEQLKSFVLTFQPTSFEKKVFKPPGEEEEQQQREVVINILNPERRVYAVCIILEEFTIIDDQRPLEKIENRLEKKKSEKSVKFKEIEVTRIEDLKIAVSQRAYTIFSHYPFFSFFEELLKALVYSAKVQRYIKYKQSGQNLKMIDSKMHGHMINAMLEELMQDGNKKDISLNQLIDFTLGPNNKIYLELTRQNCKMFLASDWAFPIFSLFTLDVFLEVLTLMALEQKMVFVCENKCILTYAIFLFTKVLMRPFEYPYPVVNLIPDQQQYLNAPFPIVYGYNKTKEEILSAKLHKKYKNVYVFFQPTGIEIVCQENKKKLLNSKSPKLRDRLLSKFKKMQRNYPKPSLTFLSFITKKEIIDYNYTNNADLAKEIIAEVYSYMQNDIFGLLPNQAQIQEIREELVQKRVEEQELNQQIFKRIKEKYNTRSRDPFFNAFLETQLLNVHIFKY